MCTDTNIIQETVPITNKVETINERYSKILKLRKDIADGKIVKVYVSENKFVWKRIK